MISNNYTDKHKHNKQFQIDIGHSGRVLWASTASYHYYNSLHCKLHHILYSPEELEYIQSHSQEILG